MAAARIVATPTTQPTTTAVTGAPWPPLDVAIGVADPSPTPGVVGGSGCCVLGRTTEGILLADAGGGTTGGADWCTTGGAD